jgi:homoserine dehydrogenase
MNEIRIGLLGFGTVGAGVVEALQKNGDLVSRRVGAALVLRRIADLDLQRDRGVRVPAELLTTDAGSVIRDPQVDVVVELIGGCGVARDFMLEALKLGKPVVTANKALLAEHGEELYRAAEQNNTEIYCEASVGGGIPIIKALREGLVANHIDAMYGILNGTCNYVLTRMEAEGLPFDAVLREAQAEGYAEAEPGLDIDGTDTAHKAVILASLAYGFNVPMKRIPVEGIRGIGAADIAYTAELGYRVKLLAIIKRVGSEVEVRVHPALVPHDHMLASVGGVFNAVEVVGDVVGTTLYYGLGAGRAATSSAVISDLADVAHNLTHGIRRSASAVRPGTEGRMRSIGGIKARYYLNVSLLDRPGMLARVAQILGAHGISIASVLQKESRTEKQVPVIIITHSALEKNFQAALEEIDSLDVVGARTVRLRIEDCA